MTIDAELSVRSRNALKTIGIDSLEDLDHWTDLELRKKLLQKRIPVHTIWDIELQLCTKLKEHPIAPESLLHDVACLMSGRLRNFLIRHVENQQLKQIDLSKLKPMPGFGECSYLELQSFIQERTHQRLLPFQAP